MTTEQEERDRTNIISTDHPRELHADFFTKSHQLVFSQLSLSPIEHDMFALFLTRLAKEHWHIRDGHFDTSHAPRYVFSTDVLADWFNVAKTNLYTTLHRPANRLANRNVGIRSDSKQAFDFIPLFKRIQYKQGMLTMVPNDELINEYLSLGQGHAQIPHVEFRALHVEYAKRLFTLLCRFRTFGKLHPQSVEDLHAYFGLLDESGNLVKTTYAKTNNFITRIIKPSIEAIDRECDDIEFDVDERTGNYGFSCIKRGRSIVAIEFLYRWKETKSAVKEIQKEVKLTLDDAIRTHRDIELREALPTVAELENFRLHMAKLLTEGFNFSTDFAANLKEVEDIIAASKE